MVIDSSFFMLIGIVSVIASLGLIIFAQLQIRKAKALLRNSQAKWKNVKNEIEAERKEALTKLKDELHRKRVEAANEIKKERIELERLQAKISSKYEQIEKREEQFEELRQDLQQKERSLLRSEDKLRSQEEKAKVLHEELISKLEALSGMHREEARTALLRALEDEVRLANQKWIAKIEEEARQTAKEKAISIVVGAMQRHTADQVAPSSSGVVHLPNDEMKGRIIGKEGRNIKSLEMATGMEFVIGDTPEIISISGFNPIRREVARRSLEKLIADGRINPTRIEETVAQCEKEIEETIEEYGQQTVLEYNIQGMHPEIVTLLGKLHFRTSFSQNVLTHSKEVGYFAKIIAEEIGLNGDIALRAGLLHDIGKVIDSDGPHAIIGGEVAKRYGEDPFVVNAISAHHEEVPFTSIYSPIVVIADTISASRPGARRETLSTYIKRLEKLEEIAQEFDGVKKAYALQAGREIRVIVEEDYLDDEKSLILAREMARRIEREMTFPGQIKVNVIREKRSIEYAR